MFPPSVPLSGKQFPVDVRDVAAARALLDEAGWKGDGIREKDGNRLAVELVISEEQIAGSRSMAEVMQAQLSEIGVELTIRSVDHASRHSDIPARKYDLAFFLTFGAPYEPFGTMIGYLDSTYDNGVDGKVVVDPKDLDPLMKKAASSNEAEVQAALQEVFDWLYENTAFAPMLYTPTIWAHTNRVDGFAAPATEYDTPFEGLHVVHG
jgi:nickel transport system substrate-binding protein